MAAEFRSFSELFRAREAPPQPAPPPEAPQISALIPHAPPPERLVVARWEERLACALERLLAEIATEVVGRELALAPVEVRAIVERQVRRFHSDGETWIDTSLGSRLLAAIDRALALEDGAERSVLGVPLLGRAIDGMGKALDGRAPPQGRRIAHGRVPLPAERAPLGRPLWTGIRAIDGLLTLARGMRIGIFGPPGSGKSRLLEAIAQGIDADAVVIALVGERGNEARARIAACDGRTTVICAPSDRSAGERLAAGDLALAHAMALRDYGLDVAVVFDSLARYVDAARQVALASGDLPGRGGYPASVWPRLAALCERAGATARGSITLIATVLSDAVDAADPLAEAARSYLDGHIVLARRRAERGAFPAIDVPASLSRPMPDAVDGRHQAAARRVRAALARLEDSREARELGLRSAEPELARAVAAEAGLEAFLRQGPEAVSAAETLDDLFRIADTV